ncbi:hypothetical protein ACFLQ6_09580 [Thermoproteota archaeon]
MRLVLTSKNIDVIREKVPREEMEGAKPDNYLTKLIKYIPSEVVALYIMLNGIVISAADIPSEVIIWIVFILCLVGTPLYLWRVTKVSDNLQLTVSTIAFIVWVFAIGGPFINLNWYHPVYGALILPAYTFFIPIIIAK